MKLRAEIETEVVGGVVLRDIQIGEKKYKLEIESNGFKGLNLRFLEGMHEAAFTIHIDKERGLRLSREVVRPNHDHNDHEDMRLVGKLPKFVNDGRMGRECDLAWFEFGPTKADY